MHVAIVPRKRQCLRSQRQRPWRTRHAPARMAGRPWARDLVHALVTEKLCRDREFSVTTDFSLFLYCDKEFSVVTENYTQAKCAWLGSLGPVQQRHARAHDSVL